MTGLSVMLAWFPALIVAIAIADVLWFIWTPTIAAIALFPLILYGLPLLVYRLHHWRYPVQPGISYLRDHTYSPWWGSHQLQLIYIAFPSLETLLRLIPGAFSAWLRLWGAQIGHSVYWTPSVEIADRGLLQIGDRVIVGHRVGLYSHIIKPRKQNLMLYVQPVKIGHDVFLGSGSLLGPGVEIPDQTLVAIDSRFRLNTTGPEVTEGELDRAGDTTLPTSVPTSPATQENRDENRDKNRDEDATG